MCKGAAVESLEREGAELRFEVARGGEDPAILLIHGWCCDHSYFAPQFEHFAGLGHTVVAPDLRGHGESGKGERYAMGDFAEDLAFLCSQLGLEKPVVIGHSMGGVIAFELAFRHPDLPAGVVMSDSPIARPEASRAGMPAFLESLEGDGYREALSDYVADALILPTDDPARRVEILAKMPETDRRAMIGAFEGMHDFDPDTEGPLHVPSLYIAADDKPLSDLPHLFRLAPEMQFGQTVGSGHFCQLEVPEQVNAMLDRFLAVGLTT